MSSTAILAEMKSDSLQYLAVLSLNRISISVLRIVDVLTLAEQIRQIMKPNFVISN